MRHQLNSALASFTEYLEYLELTVTVDSMGFSLILGNSGIRSCRSSNFRPWISWEGFILAP
jgi:hypothetical protein